MQHVQQLLLLRLLSLHKYLHITHCQRSLCPLRLKMSHDPRFSVQRTTFFLHAFIWNRNVLHQGLPGFGIPCNILHSYNITWDWDVLKGLPGVIRKFAIHDLCACFVTFYILPISSGTGMRSKSCRVSAYHATFYILPLRRNSFVSVPGHIFCLHKGEYGWPFTGRHMKGEYRQQR